MIVDKLIERVIKCKNHTVVGLDPRLDYVPSFIREVSSEQSKSVAEGVANAFFTYNKELIDHIYDLVPAVKPQIAFYEQYGLEGLKCFKQTCDYAASKGLVVISDVKRGDIGSTAEAYSEAFLGNKEYSMNTDFITVNPYLGTDSLEPFIKHCSENEKGMFVLVKTSNKSSGDLQDLVSNGKTIYEHVADIVVRLGAPYIGSSNYNFVGAVVGATYKEEAAKLRSIMSNTYFLVPGYGAQGGTAEDVVPCFNQDGLGAIVNSSRGIIAAYKSKEYSEQYSEKDFAAAARAEVIRMRDDINKALGKNNKLAW
ncbi:MAG: orotidine 5-phosphate decarboxylase, subfamily 2 [Clostridia bacterium]|jgi:orotidine-5'-phosphate decarboxylase|nr:orotidine 5-phosphate decarboxylase, subfamily 2 [Clostridia bacterium]